MKKDLSLKFDWEALKASGWNPIKSNSSVSPWYEVNPWNESPLGWALSHKKWTWAQKMVQFHKKTGEDIGLNLGMELWWGWTFNKKTPEKYLNLILPFLKSSLDNSFTDCESTLVHWVVVEKNLKALKALIKNGLDLNIKSKAGETPLFYTDTSDKSGIDIIQSLVKGGACLSEKNSRGQTFLHYLLEGHFGFNQISVDIVDFVLKSGANPNGCDEDGNTVLISLLQDLKHKKNPFRADEERFYTSQIIKLLLESNSDLEFKNKDGINALSLFSKIDDVQIQDMFSHHQLKYSIPISAPSIPKTKKQMI